MHNTLSWSHFVPLARHNCHDNIALSHILLPPAVSCEIQGPGSYGRNLIWSSHYLVGIMPSNDVGTLRTSKNWRLMIEGWFDIYRIMEIIFFKIFNKQYNLTVNSLLLKMKLIRNTVRTVPISTPANTHVAITLSGMRGMMPSNEIRRERS